MTDLQLVQVWKILVKDFALRLVLCTQHKEKGVRYLEMAEGYVTGIALDADDEDHRISVRYLLEK